MSTGGFAYAAVPGTTTTTPAPWPTTTTSTTSTTTPAPWTTTTTSTTSTTTPIPACNQCEPPLPDTLHVTLCDLHGNFDIFNGDHELDYFEECGWKAFVYVNQVEMGYVYLHWVTEEPTTTPAPTTSTSSTSSTTSTTPPPTTTTTTTPPPGGWWVVEIVTYQGDSCWKTWFKYDETSCDPWTYYLVDYEPLDCDDKTCVHGDSCEHSVEAICLVTEQGMDCPTSTTSTTSTTLPPCNQCEVPLPEKLHVTICRLGGSLAGLNGDFEVVRFEPCSWIAWNAYGYVLLRWNPTQVELGWEVIANALWSGADCWKSFFKVDETGCDPWAPWPEIYVALDCDDVSCVDVYTCNKSLSAYCLVTELGSACPGEAPSDCCCECFKGAPGLGELEIPCYQSAPCVPPECAQVIGYCYYTETEGMNEVPGKGSGVLCDGSGGHFTTYDYAEDSCMEAPT